MTINTVNLKNIDSNFDLVLCKVNTTPLCQIPAKFVDEVARTIADYDTISLTIPYHTVDSITKQTIKNPIYDLIKSERLICLNNEEYFVIKEDNHSKTNKDKTIKAYSREYKLGKIDIKVEDIGFYLIGKDDEKGIYSLNDYMKQETGWSFGYIDDTVRFDTVEGEQIEKLRWQESISMRWYDFLTTNIVESFNCIVTFDTKNKLVNLYDMDTIGEEIQIYLSMDNYLKDLEKTSNSSEIVTRLYIEGNEEMDIIGATPTGYPYLENFTYFIQNKEMSSDLINALTVYESRVIEHNIEWERLSSQKLSQSIVMKDKQNDLFTLYEKISGQKYLLKQFNDEKDKDDPERIAILAKITEMQDEQVILEEQIKKLEEEIIALDLAIDEINILCKRETATDEKGRLIFDEYLLDELKEFVYCETYTNDSFLREEDLVQAGERELDLKCMPTITYTLASVDFTKRIIDNGFRKHWNGTLSLGDIVMLQDDEEEVLQYLTGFTIKPNNTDSLSLTISNNKFKEENIRVIADKLQEASRSMNVIKSKLYLWNKQKYNRINLEKENLVDY